MAIQVIINQAGPMPIQATFQALGDDVMYLEVNGSIWSQFPDTLIGIAINIDGEQIGKAVIWSNGTATHRAVVPAYIAVQLGEGQHILTLSQDSVETVSDYNDYYTAVIHY